MKLPADVLVVAGTVVAGHRVASAPSRDYPYSSLERQIPIFRERGLDLSAFRRGTLNVDISPRQWKLTHPLHTFRAVHWTDLHPPEDFSFSPCRVRFRSAEYSGYVYYPHPETKIRNFQNPSLIEVIAETIPGLGYGSRVELLLDAQAIELRTEAS